jgi:hypothetical protein
LASTRVFAPIGKKPRPCIGALINYNSAAIALFSLEQCTGQFGWSGVSHLEDAKMAGNLTPQGCAILRRRRMEQYRASTKSEHILEQDKKLLEPPSLELGLLQGLVHVA